MEMPGRGLEPLWISPPDPKSGASANSATLARSFSKTYKFQYKPKMRLSKQRPPSCWNLTVIRRREDAWRRLPAKFSEIGSQAQTI
jgi:hypothetical protein